MSKVFINMKFVVITFLMVFISFPALAQEWESKIVYYNNDGDLEYVSDEEGNRIPDFSYAGYKNGNDTIPNIPVIATIAPIEGDNTNHINNALYTLALTTPVGADGFRGTLLFEPGIYEVYGAIKQRYTGIVLRGAGDGENPDSNTVIWARGNSPSKRTVLIMGGGISSKWEDQVSGTKTNIITDSVLIGEKVFEVDDASNYSVGDNIIIYHPCTADWLEAIDYGGTHSDDGGAEPGVDVPWEVGSQPIVYNRYIETIDGNTITIDAPVYDHLIRDLSQSYIYKYQRSGLITNIGMENIRIDIETANLTNDEAHAWNALDIYLAEDAWVRNCTFLHFGLSGVRTNTASRITVEDCDALLPVCEIEGGQRYNFQVYTASQQILFKNCNATDARHAYVSNGMSWTSGIVFYNCTSSGAYTSSEGHRRWSQGMLWDNHRELDGPRPGYNPRLLGLYNRGHYGTSHGWSIVHSVAWNCDVADGDLVVQKPPTGQNYSIGSKGKLIAGSAQSTFDEPEGYIEGSNQDGLNPQSLYLAQYKERQDKLVNVEYPTNNETVPNEFLVSQNYPNPFNPSTLIQYSLPEFTDLKIIVYDLLGRNVKTLFNGKQFAGNHYVEWKGENDYGIRVSSGVYFYSVISSFGMITKKMVLVK